MKVDSLKQILDSTETTLNYLIYGDEKFLVKNAFDKLFTKLDITQFPELNINRFDADSSVDDIRASVANLPFLADRKCVVVKDLNVSSLNQNDLDLLLDMISENSDSTVLIFYYPSLSFDQTSQAKLDKLIKIFDKCGIVYRIDKKDENDLIKFLCSRAKKLGSELPPENAGILISYCGNDLLVLTNELSKLTAFAKSRAITKDDIDSIVSKNFEAKIYDISKSILGNNLDKAEKMLNNLLYTNERAERILGAIASNYIDLYRVKVAIASGHNSFSVTEYASYKGRDFVIRNAERNCGSMSINDLRKCLFIIQDADIAIKTTKKSPRIILEELVVKLFLITKRKST
jgi:DNA polymerase-3 subunit delta